VEDWSKEKHHTFCLGRRHRSLKVILIVSNAHSRKPLKGNIEVTASSSPCGRFKTHYLMGVKVDKKWSEYEEGDIILDTCHGEEWTGRESGTYHTEVGKYDIIAYKCDLRFKLPRHKGEFTIERFNCVAKILDLGPNLAPEWRKSPKLTYRIYPWIYARYDGEDKIELFPAALDGYNIVVKDTSGMVAYGSKQEETGDEIGVNPGGEPQG
jgi:hypothetical protein